MTAAPCDQVVPEPREGSVRIFLCRHGETDWNEQRRLQGCRGNPPLNQLGVSQSRALARFLQDVPLDVVYSSPLERSRATADAIATAQQSSLKSETLAIVVDEDLKEMNFGQYEGRLLSEISDARAEFYASGDVALKWPGQGGESISDVESRARRALRRALAAPRRTGQRHVAMVAHGRFNKILLASLIYRSAARCGEIEQRNCAVNVLDFDQDGNPTLVLMNADPVAANAAIPDEV